MYLPGSGKEVDLSVLFPDLTEVTKLLEQFMSPEGAKLLLGISIRPDMVRVSF